ncbi:MAG TPA: FAD-dependent oxidoreductase [Spirochaetia bacterium]|nr:FAD-dependent oxidoreductase [Spirochaetia bacterium]
MPDMIDITLDGRPLKVASGSTILDVAESQGIRIPTLCHDSRLEPYASCWVCLVQVEKAKGFVPACSTRVTPGMVITSGSSEVRGARRMALELILSNHYGDCKAPCTLTCPSNIDIQGYLGLVANGKFSEAVELIRRDNPMPAVIGRICPRPCEGKCRRNLVEEPLNINGIKRFVADLEAQSGGMKKRPVPAPNGKKVAVVGGGPAGLAAAWYLSEKGVKVTVLEAMGKAGGMLRYGIPDYRLPPAVLDTAISQMLSLGAELRTGVTLGRDVTLEKLRAEYDAVVLAIGAWKSRGLRIPGENHPSVLSGIDFLRDVNEGRPVKVGDVVAIIGGGNTAMDAARCSLRHGASTVTMYYRRTREEMPASDAEIEEALEEGIDIQYLAAPVSIQAEGDALKGLTLLKMALGEPDASGRRRPVPVEGSEYTVPVDTIICAVGQYPDTKLLSALPGLVDEKGNLLADMDTGRSEVPGVFAAGDLLTGTDIAIRAVAGGKHAARAALAYLEGRTYSRPKEFLSRKSDFREPTTADFETTPHAPRAHPTVMEPERRKRTFAEIESTLTMAAAQAEAARCLECGCQDVRDCALKMHATEYEAVATRYNGETTVHPVDESHPFISRDPSKCVLCARCVRVCLDVQAIGVFGYINRGFTSVVAPSFGVPFGEDTSCISCGQCVSACPVGALTEKLPARKNVPLPETAVEGTCTRCSVGCAIEYRWHGSLFTRIVERNGPPNFSKLCKNGKFGHEFLNDPLPPAADLEKARAAVSAALAGAKRPVMRISPYLGGEAIDAFLQAAAKRGIPVRAAGLEKVDARWSKFLSQEPAAAKKGARELLVLIGDIGGTNNVAFTEAYRQRRAGSAELWVLGHDDEVARRAAKRVIPDAAQGISEALKTDAAVIACVNPQTAPAGVLEALLASADKLQVRLYWGSRNAGYLFAKQAAAAAAPDLYLDVGVEEPTNGVRRLAWGKKRGDEELFIPLSREHWILGRSHPTGLPSVEHGKLDLKALQEAASLI